MSTAEKTSRIDLALQRMNAYSDWINPIVIKEVRQSLKSKLFVTTFMLSLAACWAISVIGIMFFWNVIEYSPVSLQFFICYYWVLAFALFVVIPFGAFGSLQTERDQNTFEILQITTLQPSQIVTGKLASAMLQAIILYAVIAPFIAFSSLLQGFDLLRVSYEMTISLAICMGASMCCLMLSTLGKQKNFRTLMVLFLLGGLVSLFSSQASFAAYVMAGGADFDTEFYLWNLLFFLGGLSYFFLFHQITVAQLTFEAENRSFGIRVIATAQFYLLWICMYAISIMYASTMLRYSDDYAWSCAVISNFHWAIVGFFAVTEAEPLSRRIRRDLPKSFWKRWLMVSFLPGGSRGFFLVTKHLLLTIPLMLGLQYVTALAAGETNLPTLSGLLSDHKTQSSIAQIGYIIFFLGMGRLITAGMMKAAPSTRPAHGRVVMLIMTLMCVLSPYLILWLVGYYENRMTLDYHPLMVINPVESLRYINDNDDAMSRLIFSFAVLAGGIVLLANLPGTLRGLRQGLWPERPDPYRALDYSTVREQLQRAEETGVTAVMG
jgi:hypothetical protein